MTAACIRPHAAFEPLNGVGRNASCRLYANAGVFYRECLDVGSIVHNC